MEHTELHKDIFEKHDWEVSLQDFKEIIEANLIPIIDVREPHEVATVRVNAKTYANIPLKEIDTALQLDKVEFLNKYSINKPNKDDPIVLVCRSGRRSNLGLKTFRDCNYLNTRHYNGGTNVWVENYPDEVIRSAT